MYIPSGADAPYKVCVPNVTCVPYVACVLYVAFVCTILRNVFTIRSIRYIVTIWAEYVPAPCMPSSIALASLMSFGVASVVSTNGVVDLCMREDGLVNQLFPCCLVHYSDCCPITIAIIISSCRGFCLIISTWIAASWSIVLCEAVRWCVGVHLALPHVKIYRVIGIW